MGILMGAMGGMGAALQNMGEANQKADLLRGNELAVGQQRSDLELQRQQTLEAFKMSLGETQRANQVSRIDGATNGIIGGMQSKRVIDSYGADGEGLTAADISDEERKGFPASDAEMAKARMQAAIATGDIDPRSAAVMGQKDDALMYKALYEQSKEEGRAARLDATEEGRFARQQAALDAREKQAEIKAGSGGNVSREERMRYTSLLGDAGRRLGEAEKALSTLQKDPFSKIVEPGSPRAKELDDLRESVKGYREEHKMYQGLLAGSQSGGAEARPNKPGAPTAAKSTAQAASVEAEMRRRGLIK